MTSPVLTHDEPFIVVDAKGVQRIKELALSSPYRRARLCLHRDNAELVQEMIIALANDCYFPPHRHKNKTESFHMIEGELFILIFEDDGTTKDCIHMKSKLGEGQALYYRMCMHLWHAVVPVSPVVIYHETTNGPFIAGEAEFASFAPREGQGLVNFLNSRVKSYYAQSVHSEKKILQWNIKS